LSELDYVSHKHATGSPSDKLSAQRDPDLHWVLSSRQKDWQRISLYRYCDKVRVAKGSNQYPDEIGDKTGLSKCVQCQFRKSSAVQYKLLMLTDLFIGLAYNTSVTICVRGGCNHFIYCASCTLGTSPGRIIDHRHKESTYKVMLHRRVQLPVAKMTCFKCRRGKSNSSVLISIFMIGNLLPVFIGPSHPRLSSFLNRLYQRLVHRHLLRPLQTLWGLLVLHRGDCQGWFQ
jgi:hypothetical protein